MWNVSSGVFPFYWQVTKDAANVFYDTLSAWQFWVAIAAAIVVRVVIRLRPQWRLWLQSRKQPYHRWMRWVAVAAVVAISFYSVLRANYTRYHNKEKEVEQLTTQLAAIRGRQEAESAARPDLTIEVQGGYLEVRNRGGAGHVQARVRVANAYTFPSTPPISEDARYDALWESSGNGQSNMLSGQVDRIILSGKSEGDAVAFHYFHGLTQRADSFVAKGGAPLLSVEVTFLADPPLASGAIVKRYMIGTNGLTYQP